MSAPPTRQRPQHEAEGASEVFSGTDSILGGVTDPVVAYFLGRHDEREFGQGPAFQRGWQAADEHAERLLGRAVSVVHAAARLPERDRAADRARRERIEARWSA